MRTVFKMLVMVLALAALGVGCESNSGTGRDALPSAGGNGAFGEGTANPGEHSDQHFRDSVDDSATHVPATQLSR